MRQMAIMQLVQEMSCQLIHYVNVKTMNCWFVQGQEAEDGLGCRRPMASQKRPRMDAAPRGRARHARLLEAPEGENNEQAGVQEIRRKLGFFFYTTHLGYLASLDRRVCRGPCFWNRTGPAVGPLKDRIRTSTGLVHLKDRPCNWTGKNQLNRPVFCKTGEPGSFLWTGAVF